MLGALLLGVLVARLPGLLAATQPRTLVRAGLLVPVEERHQEQLLTAAVEIFNEESEWLQVEPISVFISMQDILLRSFFLVAQQLNISSCFFCVCVFVTSALFCPI